MDMPSKILSGKEKVDPNCWFTMASDSQRVTRQFADPLNIIGQEHKGWTKGGIFTLSELYKVETVTSN